MMMSELIQANALLAANVLLLGAAAIELLRVRRSVRRQHVAQPETVTAAEDPRRWQAALDQRIETLGRMLDEIERREHALERRAVPPPPVRVDAVRMAKNGASSHELARACGLNRGEAELLVRLHAARRA